MTPEPYVSAEAAAQFLGVPRRFLLSLARKGMSGAYPIGTGEIRKRWVFLLSEVSSAIRRPVQSEPRYDRSIRRSSLKRG